MNSNLFHNIANIAMIAIAGVTAAMVAMGCTETSTGALECSESTLLSPGTATMIIAALGVIKMIVNVVRDGFSGLTKRQPPVE